MRPNYVTAFGNVARGISERGGDRGLVAVHFSIKTAKKMYIIR